MSKQPLEPGIVTDFSHRLSDYEGFRSSLGSSSGFQSAQYRAIEFLLGNKHRALLNVFRYDPPVHAELTALLEAPPLYDEFLRLCRDAA